MAHSKQKEIWLLMKKLKTENFAKCSMALDFIDGLKKKNRKCEGYLNCTSNKDYSKVEWHVTYNPELLKVKD